MLKRRLTIVGCALVVTLSGVGIALADDQERVGDSSAQPTAAPVLAPPANASPDCAVSTTAENAVPPSARTTLAADVRASGDSRTNDGPNCLIGTAP